MFKTHCMSITNPETNKTVQVSVNALNKSTLRNGAIGGGVILLGVIYLVLSSFKNGAKTLVVNEDEAYRAAGLVSEVGSETREVIKPRDIV